MKPALLRNKCVLVEDNVIYDSKSLQIIGVDDSSLTIITSDNLSQVPAEAHESLLECIGNLVFLAFDRGDGQMLLDATKMCDEAFEMIVQHIEN